MVESAPCTNHDLSDIDRQQIPTHSPAGRDALLASQAEHSPDHENEDDAPDGLEGLSEYTLEELRDLSDEVDYYAVLGLPRDPVPTDAQIRSAYHTISLTFHPDKHCESSFLAREQFAAIENAYATLIDPQKRVVYDLLGAAGVQREWTRDGVMYAYAEEKTIGVRAMDPREFKAWFLYKMKQRERAVLEDMVASRVRRNRIYSSLFWGDEVYGAATDPRLRRLPSRSACVPSRSSRRKVSPCRSLSKFRAPHPQVTL